MLIWSDPWSHDVLIYYQTQGYLREDVRIIASAQVVSVLGPDAPALVVEPMQSADRFLFQYR